MNFLTLLSSTSSIVDFKLSIPSLPVFLPSSSSTENSAFRKVKATQGVPPLDLGGPTESSVVAILQQRQRLINEFLQLNIELLQKEIMQADPVSSLPLSSQTETAVRSGSDSRPSHKKIKKATHCGHEQRPHYAKGMCSTCYHRYGRVKKPWNCSHDKLYAAGLCQNCYINEYNRKRREEGRAQEKMMTVEGNENTTLFMENDRMENEIVTSSQTSLTFPSTT